MSLYLFRWLTIKVFSIQQQQSKPSMPSHSILFQLSTYLHISILLWHSWGSPNESHINGKAVRDSIIIIIWWYVGHLCDAICNVLKINILESTWINLAIHTWPLPHGLARLSTSLSASERTRCLKVDSAEQREVRLQGKQLATESIEKETSQAKGLLLSLTTDMQLCQLCNYVMWSAVDL